MLQPRIVIVGGGFAGLYAARALGRAPVAVTLVDRRNHHLFQPLLYQVATAALAAPDVAAPIRRVLRKQRNTTVLLGDVRRIDVQRREVVLADGVLAYDWLVLAAGATHSYFGREEWAAFAPGLKSIEDAFEIRRRILLAFEAAEREPGRREWLTFVIVGAGPTGVELAGALQEMAQRTLARDFRNFDPRSARVVLVDAAERVLPGFPPDLSGRAKELLTARGVEVRTGTRVVGVDETGVAVAGEREERIAARTVLWAAGVQGSPLARSLGVELTRDGRVLVQPDLTVPGHPEIFVAGDLAALEQDGAWVPGMAPAAIQEGRHAAANLMRALRGEPLAPFRYRDRGLLATVGRSSAVAALGRLHFAGFFAWVLWLGVHIVWLIGFRTRVIVLIEWAWAYLTWQRSARVILETAPFAADLQRERSPGAPEGKSPPP